MLRNVWGIQRPGAWAGGAIRGRDVGGAPPWLKLPHIILCNPFSTTTKYNFQNPSINVKKTLINNYFIKKIQNFEFFFKINLKYFEFLFCNSNIQIWLPH